MQIGNSDIPKFEQIPGMQMDYYRFKTSITEDIQEANLVVSHAGAGSCLEVLEARKPLVVVINQQLMNNHQLELAEQLQADEHLFYSSCSNLGTTLELMDLTKLKPFPAGNGKDFVDFLDSLKVLVVGTSMDRDRLVRIFVVCVKVMIDCSFAV
uniref:UDP-N-acetylglucosamine transferase subunit ALG13 n=1 Tax=Timema cristinae TaxID=61476 RepID=A0A7R9D0A3_TIMCR|nr:unnamed protein product [Timema cristinae]